MNKYEILTVDELINRCNTEEANLAKLPLSDPSHPSGFIFDEKHKTLDIWWGGEEYSIQLHRIDTPTKALFWLEHLCGKEWKGITPWHIFKLINTLSHRFNWRSL